MSTNLIKKRIIDFLQSDNKAIIAIKGNSGVGKTHTWKTILNGLIHKKNSINTFYSRYCYVSLYGINSLDDLKVELNNHIEINKDSFIESIWNYIKRKKNAINIQTNKHTS